MNFSEEWDKREKKSGGLTIDAFIIRTEEFIVILRDNKGKVLDITTEQQAPPRSLQKDLYYKAGAYRCPACAYPYESEIVNQLQNLAVNEELDIKCRACSSNHVYFKKGKQPDIEKIREFLVKYLK